MPVSGFSSSGGAPSGPTTYAAILAAINNPRRRNKIGGCKIAHNTFAKHTPETGAIHIRLFSTTILTLYPDGETVCGTSYHSMLTRGRMNAYLPSGWRAFSGNDVTYIEGPDGFLMPMVMGIVVGWDTAEVKRHLRALRINPNKTREASHARAELALFYTRRIWPNMAQIMKVGSSGSAFEEIPRRIRTPHWYRQQWPTDNPLWLADDDGCLIRPVTGEDVAFEQVCTYAEKHPPYAWIDGKKYLLVDPVERFEASQDVRHAQKRAQLEAT